MIDFDELRKEVAIRHNLLLTPDDPVLATVTLNELVLARYVELLTSQNEGHLVAINAALDEHVRQAKETGGALITAATNHVCDQIRLTVTAQVSEMQAKLQTDLGKAKDAARQAAMERDTAKTASAVTKLAALVSVIFALASVGVFATSLVG